MPHKRNPVLAERIGGFARLLRADALVGLENMALWHERDISHSSAERFVFERALGVAAYATRSMTGLLRGGKAAAPAPAERITQREPVPPAPRRAPLPMAEQRAESHPEPRAEPKMEPRPQVRPITGGNEEIFEIPTFLRRQNS